MTRHIPTVPFSACLMTLLLTLFGQQNTLPAQSALPPDMVFVQSGTFEMGCTTEQMPDCATDEIPIHEVTLSDFYMGKYEVTQGQWESLMGYTQAQMRDLSNPTSSLNGVGYTNPIYYASWYDAAVFCNRLSEQQGYTPCYYVDAGYTQVYGKNANIWNLPNTDTVFWKPYTKGYRLPTEAEWEYAARGGCLSKGYKYSGSNTVGDVAWYNINPGSTTYPVGTKDANELGLFDMSGNVWEWCHDWYSNTYYSNSTVCAPTGPLPSTIRVHRGGSWNIFAQRCRTTNRSGNDPQSRKNSIGFRLVRSAL